MKSLTHGSWIAGALLVVLTASFWSPAALADDAVPNGASGRVHYDHYRDRGGDRDWHRRDKHRGGWRNGWHDRRDRDRTSRNRVIIEDRAPASGGTYSGGITNYRDRGNGEYLFIERDRDYGAPRSGATVPLGAGPKVINPGGASACASEGGVCVIRPGS
ncbi:hypothetical protein [Pararhizobium haloflavum]|uniref:hypothetical protein n=1 Tax=Pararhizobium haloflavum TaxID=2037914 RepID=UPI000C19F4D7|nr:hypothetical protein [Pararhizobium haloflavum]